MGDGRGKTRRNLECRLPHPASSSKAHQRRKVIRLRGRSSRLLSRPVLSCRDAAAAAAGAVVEAALMPCAPASSRRSDKLGSHFKLARLAHRLGICSCTALSETPSSKQQQQQQQQR